MNPRVISQRIGGNPLTLAALEGTAPNGWYERLPHDDEGWRRRVDDIRASNSDWLELLAPAFSASGKAAARLAAAANGQGVVVTTGQQPGLFGGPVYTLSKALSALAFADALQEMTGLPVAPVFWAATDDTDFKEASSTVVSVTGGAQILRIDHAAPLGRQMSAMPLGDVSTELDALIESSGAAIDTQPLEILKRFYTGEATIGSAFVGLLRTLLEPLGIAVIDASHPATRAAALATLGGALAKSGDISERLAERASELESAGFKAQVQDVPGLSLVFSSSSGSRKRIPIKAARKMTPTEDFGPNVLLRPIVERAILPTATYIGGPAEIAYFAQIGPIADALGSDRPAILPRWSCTIMEPHVEGILEKLYLMPEDLRDPHAVEARVARAHIPVRVFDELNETRAAIDARIDALSDAVAQENSTVTQSVTGGLRANLMRRLDRFERRLIAAAKRKHADIMMEIGTARGSLFPDGKPQERALNFIPMLARYGPALRDEMLAQARLHARSALTGSVLAASMPAEPQTSTTRA